MRTWIVGILALLLLLPLFGCVTLNKDAIVALTNVVSEAEGYVEVHDPELDIVVHMWDVGMTVKLANVDVSGSASGGDAPPE